jgi:predicted ATPase
MALHSGAVETRDGDYFGPPLNRVARLMSAGYGGQTLLSAITRELVQTSLPPDAELRDMGERRLKDLTRPEHIYQLLVPDLPTDFPPLKTLEAFRTNLPAQLTSFIGREKEIAAVKRLIAANRLTTLTGSGGAGKTRLSLQVASELLDSFSDGVWFIEFAPLSDPALVLQTVTNTLGLREEAGRPLLDVLTDYLRAKKVLLILDNCEHLVEAAAQLVQALLRACPNLHLLISSREALGIPGETAYRVPSLSIPDTYLAQSAETVTQCEAARLFIERAQTALPAFVVTDKNAPAVAQVCSRLDGIPLAIELAAARVKMLKVEQIAERLDDRFRLLTGGSRTALPRQQTLQAMIDWSYDLLPEPERALLRRLSVFAGGWTLEAAETVCQGSGIDDYNLLELLTQLINKSLVVVDADQEIETRYRLLETVRQYAREKLSEAGEGLEVRDRHLQYFLGLAERAEPQVQGAEQQAWLDRLEVEHDNFRAALEWSLGGEETRAQAGLRIASSLWWFWFMRGHGDEGGEWFKRALTASQASGDLVTRAKALSKFGWLKSFSAARAEECLALSRALGPAGRESMALALWGLGAAAWYQADYARAKSLEEESLQLFREIGHRWGICETLVWLGNAMSAQGDHQQATLLFEESLVLARQARDANEIGWALWQLGGAAMVRGDYDQATSLLEESLVLQIELKSYLGIPWLLNALGNVALHKGDYLQAAARYKEILTLFWERGDERRIAESLEQLANVAAVSKQPQQAARLFGAAQALRESSGAALHPYQCAEYEHCLDVLRPQLDETILTGLWAEGQALTMKQAVTYALEATHA